MTPYKVFINLDVLDEVPRSGKARSEIMAFIRSLETDPSNLGDYCSNDSIGRPIYTKIIGNFAVTFWADTPVREVKIIQVQRADGNQ